MEIVKQIMKHDKACCNFRVAKESLYDKVTFSEHFRFGEGVHRVHIL